MSETPSRPMKYPYTFSAKMAQFPLKFHVSKQWLWRYYFVGVALSLPIFVAINNLANSPANLRNYEEYKRKEALEHHH